MAVNLKNNNYVNQAKFAVPVLPTIKGAAKPVPLRQEKSLLIIQYHSPLSILGIIFGSSLNVPVDVGAQLPENCDSSFSSTE